STTPPPEPESMLAFAYSPLSTRSQILIDPGRSAMYSYWKPTTASEGYQRAPFNGYPWLEIQSMQFGADMPRSRQSNTRSVSTGGVRNLAPPKDVIVSTFQKTPNCACPGVPGGTAPGHRL